MNVELAEQTYQTIAALDTDQDARTTAITEGKDWEQGDWRCNTGMCYAGHAATLAGGGWVVPLGLPVDHNEAGVEVTWTDPAADGWNGRASKGWSRLDLAEYLYCDQWPDLATGWARTGPTAPWRPICEAEEYATRALDLPPDNGAIDGDARNLFRGTNDLQAIRRVLDQLQGR